MSKFTPCRLPISVLLCMSAVSWHCIRDIYFKLSCSGLRESTQPATSFSSLLTYVVIFFHSLTHLFTGSHTHTVADCGAARVKPHLWVVPSFARTMMLSVESCWTYHRTFLFLRLMLAPLQCLYLSVLSHTCLLKGKYLSYRYVVAEGRERERESYCERQIVREMKCSEIAVLSEPLLIRGL